MKHSPTVPYVSFEFNESGIEEHQEFSLTFGTNEVRHAEPLAHKLDFVPEPPSQNMEDIIIHSAMDNEAGSLSVTERPGVYVVHFGFNPFANTANELPDWNNRYTILTR